MDRFRKNAYRRGQIGCPATKIRQQPANDTGKRRPAISQAVYHRRALHVSRHPNCRIGVSGISGHTLHTPEPEVEEDHPDHHRAQRTTDRIHPKYIGADGTDTRRNEQIGSRIANHSTQTSKSHTSPYRCPKTVRKS